MVVYKESPDTYRHTRSLPLTRWCHMPPWDCWQKLSPELNQCHGLEPPQLWGKNISLLYEVSLSQILCHSSEKWTNTINDQWWAHVPSVEVYHMVNTVYLPLNLYCTPHWTTEVEFHRISILFLFHTDSYTYQLISSSTVKEKGRYVCTYLILESAFINLEDWLKKYKDYCIIPVSKFMGAHS